MKTYYGMLLASWPTILVYQPGADRPIRPLDPGAGQLDHVPLHIRWGGVGPGSLRTAYTMLFDALEDHGQAEALMYDFMREVVSRLDPWWWSLPLGAIHEFALRQQGHLIV